MSLRKDMTINERVFLQNINNGSSIVTYYLSLIYQFIHHFYIYEYVSYFINYEFILSYYGCYSYDLDF